MSSDSKPRVVFLHKAQRTVSDEEVPGIEIRIEREIPREASLDQQRISYRYEARRLADALRSALPGGTFDRLIGELLAMKASDFLVAHDRVLRAAAGESTTAPNPQMGDRCLILDIIHDLKLDGESEPQSLALQRLLQRADDYLGWDPDDARSGRPG